MADQDGQRAGLGSFVCIMISSFFVFAFINGVLHSLYTLRFLPAAAAAAVVVVAAAAALQQKTSPVL